MRWSGRALSQGQRPERLLLAAGRQQESADAQVMTGSKDGYQRVPMLHAEPGVSEMVRGPYGLLPRSRGSIHAGLEPKLLMTTAEWNNPPPGSSWVTVHAVGINFRDVLNVLGMYPGDPGPPGTRH